LFILYIEIIPTKDLFSRQKIYIAVNAQRRFSGGSLTGVATFGFWEGIRLAPKTLARVFKHGRVRPQSASTFLILKLSNPFGIFLCSFLFSVLYRFPAGYPVFRRGMPDGFATHTPCSSSDYF